MVLKKLKIKDIWNELVMQILKLIIELLFEDENKMLWKRKVELTDKKLSADKEFMSLREDEELFENCFFLKLEFFFLLADAKSIGNCASNKQLIRAIEQI